MNLTILWGSLIPLLGTTLGAACVFLLQGEIGPRVQKGLLGFASGVMVAASVWSLLIPAIDQCSRMGRLAFLPPVIGFLLGIGFLLTLDQVVPHQHLDSDCPEGTPCRAKGSTMLMLAVTLHNIPEGMAVGVVLAGLRGSGTISAPAAMALSVGIAIQNLPEGAVISMPLKEALGKKQAFLYGVLSGVVEPIGALLTVGVMTHLALQTFLNIAVVSGFVPTTGISLPFFSYGGTALCLQLVEMGIVLSVSRQIPAARAG